MRPYQIIDNALDAMFAADPALVSFSRNDVAGVLKCTPDRASWLLQQHRTAQRTGVTRYVVAGRGYARAARWFVLAAAGAKIGTGARRRLTMAHGEHIAIDAARRVISDLTAELDPALVQHPAIQAYLTHARANMEASVRLVVSSVQSAVTLIEGVTRETADRSRIKAV